MFSTHARVTASKQTLFERNLTRTKKNKTEIKSLSVSGVNSCDCSKRAALFVFFLIDAAH